MSKIVIIGGGLAGLSAAVNLLEKGHSVEIFEATKSLGGRAKSFFYSNQSQYVDNGQHLLMGCYDYTLEFVNKIGADDNFDFQKTLSVVFIDENGKNHPLRAFTKLYPINLMVGVLNYSFLNLKEKFHLVKFVVTLFYTNPDKLKNISVLDWLKKKKQNKNIIDGLWHLLAISALNTNLNVIPAKSFAVILKQMFLRNNKSSTIVIPKKSLSESIIFPAEKHIKKIGGIINTSERIIGIENTDSKQIKVKTSKKNIITCDYIISAVTPNVLAKIINNDSLNEFEYSPIISVNIWLKENIFTEKFYGFINSDVHWLFNHGKFISLVISGADKFVDMSNEEILLLCNKEIKKYFPAYSESTILDSKIVKEKKATINPNFRIEELREKTNIDYNNLYICGDWTNTGLPATIESAVKSGKMIADIL